MSAERAGLGSRPAHQIAHHDDRLDGTTRCHTELVDSIQCLGWPRPASEIRADLEQHAIDCHEAGVGCDPRVLDRLADELRWCAALLLVHGGPVSARPTEQLARTVEETAELARLLRARREEVAA